MPLLNTLKVKILGRYKLYILWPCFDRKRILQKPRAIKIFLLLPELSTYVLYAKYSLACQAKNQPKGKKPAYLLVNKNKLQDLGSTIASLGEENTRGLDFSEKVAQISIS